MIWNDEADRLLLSLWNDGGSLGFVASGLQKAGYTVSRNAVAGRKHRLIGKTERTTIKTVAKPRPPRPPQRSKPMTEKKSVTIDDLKALTEHDGIDYLDLTPFGCKAILDRPRGGEWMLQKVCGLPRCEGSPYCRAHFKLYTNQQPMPRRAHG